MVRNNTYDLIHAVEESAFMAIFMKIMFHIPYVYDMDSSLPSQIADKYKCLRIVTGIMGAFEGMAVRSSLGVLAVCKSLEEIAVNYAPDKLVHRLEDISLLQSESERGEILRESLGIDSPVIMYIGNLEKYQGVDLLLESFELARSKGADAHLVIIGGNKEDIEKYKDQSRKADIGDRTHFIGQRAISQLGSFLEQADILVSPRIEGQNTPMKIYSYLESGRPVLATRLPTHTQVLDDQVSLLVAPEKEAMSEGLVLLINDQKLGHEIARRAKERVKQEFTYDAFKRKLLGFYQVLEKELSSYQYGI
jgi:glycosyltransferase involved in cell wall biosynthesis